MEHCPKSVHCLGVQNAMNDLIRRPQKIDASGRVIHDPRIPADRWILNIPPSMNGGKKVRLFFRTLAEANAERKRRIEAHEGTPRELRAQLSERGLTPTDAVNYCLKHAPKTQKISVAEGCNRFFLSREASNCKPRYISTLKSTLKPFVAKFGKRMMHEIQKDDLELYVQRLTAKDGRTQAAPRTRANTVGYLKALFTFAVEEGWRGESPAATLRKPIPDETAVSILSPGDVAKLIETALQEAYRDILPALLLQLYAGPRRAEVPHIHWANIKDKYLRLSITKVREVRGRRASSGAHTLARAAQEWRRAGAEHPRSSVQRLGHPRTRGRLHATARHARIRSGCCDSAECFPPYSDHVPIARDPK
ncbi:MAG: hypothetical protein FJ382_14110 [Verrucomicrobia bacterium]|nr:hypothetical protein [Verrucomicrobiota bacterium]